MPECLAGARVEATLLCRRNKTRDGSLVRGSEEEGLVKSTAARKLGISRLEPCVFRDLPCAHMVESCDANTNLFGNVIQCGADFLVWAP